MYNLFVTSKNETTNSPIHQFTNLKCCKNFWPESLLKPPFNDVLLNNSKNTCFFHFKGFKRHFAALSIRELVNWWFRFLMSRTGW